MQALTRLNPTDPVRFDGMNTILGEIEGRDEDLLNKINELSEADVDLLDKINDLEGKKADKYYMSLADIDLSDAEMSSTDLGANIKKILDAMKQYTTFKTYVYNNTPNFLASITESATSKSDAYSIEINRTVNNNIPNKVILQPNTNNGLVKEQWAFFDNVWGGFKEVARYESLNVDLQNDWVQGHSSYEYNRVHYTGEIPTFNWLIKTTSAVSSGDIIATGFKPLSKNIRFTMLKHVAGTYDGTTAYVVYLNTQGHLISNCDIPIGTYWLAN